MRKLRSFQKLLVDEAKSIASGSGKRVVTAAITPGGGKSYGAALFAKELLGSGIVDTVIWLVPRRSLVSQVSADLPLRDCDNNPPLIRDRPKCVGYAATYQAVEAATELHELAAGANKTLLIVDEFHHLAIDDKKHGSIEGAWCHAVQRVADHSEIVLAMSGTMYRSDRKRIAFAGYDQAGNPEPADVTYSRSQATEENAKLRIVAEWIGGSTLWDTKEGGEVESPTSPADSIVKPHMLHSLVKHKGWVTEAVSKGVSHWAEHRLENPKAQCLVVTWSQDLAQDVYDDLRTQLPGVKVEVAISRETSKSRRAVKRYRKREVDLLVSVGMAYEGLDAPSTTHVICLRGYRSAPWLEQCADRATRIDPGNTKKDRAWLFMPDVEDLHDSWALIMAEQQIPTKKPGDAASNGGGTGDQQDPDVSLRSATIGEFSDLRRTVVLARFRTAFPGVDMSDDSVMAMELAGAINWPELPVEEANAYDPEEEKSLRKQANKLCNNRDKRNGLEPGATNRSLFDVFRKSRTKMGAAELTEVVAWLKSDGRANGWLAGRAS